MKKDVELDLWPALERGHLGRYEGWVLWMKKRDGTVPDDEPGFKKTSGRWVAGIPDNLGLVKGDCIYSVDHVKMETSKKATRQMVDVCVEESCGDRDWAIAAMPGVEKHPWMEGFRGLG